MPAGLADATKIPVEKLSVLERPARFLAEPLYTTFDQVTSIISSEKVVKKEERRM